MKYAERAKRVLASHKGKYRIAAFGERKGKLVSIGINDYIKTHPKQKEFAIKAGMKNRQYLHAEIAAIIKARSNIDSLFVYRLDNKGRFQNATPCPVCRLAIQLSGIKRVYHS